MKLDSAGLDLLQEQALRAIRDVTLDNRPVNAQINGVKLEAAATLLAAIGRPIRYV